MVGFVSSTSEPVVDCAFGLSAAMPDALLPADNAYFLYAAISRVLPWLHESNAIGIHPLRGRLVGHRSLLLPKRSSLTFRTPVDAIGRLLPLAGQTLTVAGVGLQVGTPEIRPLKPASTVASGLVTIRGFQEPDSFLAAVQRQLVEMDVSGVPRLITRRYGTAFEAGGVGGKGEWVRRTLRLKDREIVGFALEVGELSVQDSLKLQEAGLGGRRKFGCGVLVPAGRSS